MPAPAGPKIRAEWIRKLLSPTALTTRSEPTISMTKLWRVGLSTAFTEPRTKTSANTIQGSTAPVAVSPQSASAGSAISDWRRDQQRALRDAVGEQPAPGAEEEDRQELERGRHPDREAAAGQRQDQPDLGDHLHPVAADRDQLPGEVAPVVRDLERCEGAAERGGHRGSRSSRSSRISAARSSVVELLGDRARAGGARGRRSCACAAASAARRPSGLALSRETRPSVGSVAFADQPVLDRGGRRPGWRSGA